MHVSGYIVVPPARLHRATAAVQAALPKVLSMLLGLGQVKEESRRGNGTVTLGWAPVRPPPGPRYRRTAARRPAETERKVLHHASSSSANLKPGLLLIAAAWLYGLATYLWPLS